MRAESADFNFKVSTTFHMHLKNDVNEPILLRFMRAMFVYVVYPYEIQLTPFINSCNYHECYYEHFLDVIVIMKTLFLL